MRRMTGRIITWRARRSCEGQGRGRVVAVHIMSYDLTMAIQRMYTCIARAFRFIGEKSWCGHQVTLSVVFYWPAGEGWVQPKRCFIFLAEERAFRG